MRGRILLGRTYTSWVDVYSLGGRIVCNCVAVPSKNMDICHVFCNALYRNQMFNLIIIYNFFFFWLKCLLLCLLAAGLDLRFRGFPSPSSEVLDSVDRRLSLKKFNVTIRFRAFGYKEFVKILNDISSR